MSLDVSWMRGVSRARLLLISAGVLAAAVLSACAGGGRYSESSLLDELERSGVARPGRDGEWRTPGADTEGGAEEEAARLPEEGAVTLADLLRIAEARNAGLAAARSGAGVAAAEAWQAWMHPNPRVEVEAEEIGFDDGTDPAEVTVGVSQPIVLSGRREAGARAAEAERDARLADAEAARQGLFGAVAAEYGALLTLRRQASLHAEMRALVDATLETARVRHEAGAAPEMEMIRVRVESKRLTAALARVERETLAGERRLASLLGGVEVGAERLGEESAPLEAMDFDALAERVRKTHPVLRAGEHRIVAAEARLELARERVTPDLEVRAAVGYSNERDDGVVEVGAGMEVPLWDRSEGEILKERFGVMRARQHVAAETEEIVRALAAAVGEYESAREEATALRAGIVPDAQRAFDLTRAAYEGGRVSFMDMFDAQRTLVEARVALAEAEGRAWAARAEVARVAGDAALTGADEEPDADGTK